MGDKIQDRSRYKEILETLEIKTPLDILALFHPQVNAGTVTLHKWQRDFNIQIAAPSTKDKPNRNYLIAANGSGKSQFVMAPWALWLLLCFEDSACVVTSASGSQLDKQAGRHIKLMCERVNTFFSEHFGLPNLLEIQVRKIENKIFGGILDLFATDESGKAEGWHALVPGGKFGIGVDEAKTVADDIFDALDRCNDYTDKLLLSSPGNYEGMFYKIATIEPQIYKGRKVTAFECAHIGKEKIQEQIALHGEFDPLVRSSIFAEFTSVGSECVLFRESILDCQKYFEDTGSKHFGELRAGLDLSAGGDEQVLSIWHGCFLVKELAFRFTYAPQLVDAVISALKAYKIKAENVWADDGGVGEIQIDMFQEKGWCFNRVLNQGTPLDKTRYANRGTEMWYNFKRFVEEYQVFIPKENDKLVEQLSRRHYKISNGKIQLEAKREARAKGHPSPDRADAAVLAWCGLIFPLADLQIKPKPVVVPKTTPEEIIAWYDMEMAKRRRAEDEGNSNVVNGKYVRANFTFNLREILNKTRNRYESIRAKISL